MRSQDAFLFYYLVHILKSFLEATKAYSGKLLSQVAAGLECGIGMDDYNDWEAGDVIEAFNTIKKQRTLEEASASVTAALAGAGIQL